MNSRNWYFRQPLKENELDAAFSDVELADQRIVKDLKLFGIASGGAITEVSPLHVDIAEWAGHDKQGRRISYGGFVNLDFTNDSSGNPNTPSAGNFRWVTFVARHGYVTSDSRTDGNTNPVDFLRTETISSTGDDNNANAGKLQILQGAQAATSNAAARPAAGTDDIIVGDVLIDDTGAIIANGISYSRVPHPVPHVIVPYNALDSYVAGQMVLDGGVVYQAIVDNAPGTATSTYQNWKAFQINAAPGVYTEPAHALRNSRRSRVSGFDHFGYPSGHIITLDEPWLDVNATTKTATGTGGWFGKWNYRINNGGGLAGTGLQANGATSAPGALPWGSVLGMNVFGASVEAVGVVELVKPFIYMQQASLVMEWAFSIFDGGGSGTPLSNTSWAMGLSFGGIVADGSTSPIRTGSANYDGAYLWGNGTDPNWGFLMDNNSDPGADTNTGVAVDAGVPHFAKIVLQGTAAGHDGSARIICFIDGVVVANTTISMVNKFIAPFFRVTASQGEVCILEIGRVRAHARIALNDEFGP